MKKIFRLLLVTSFLLYLGWFASFYYAFFLFSDKVANVIIHTGSNAWISLPEQVYWIFPILWLIATIGMFQFSEGARKFFVFLTVVSIATDTVSGLLLQSGPQAALMGIINLMDGAIIATAFLTSIDMEFKNAVSNK